MKKLKKIAITLLLILFVITPGLFLIIYPNYNDILLTLNSFNVYNLSRETTMKVLTNISPLRDSYEEQILGYTSIEESLQGMEISLDEKVLEDQNTRLLIETLNIEGEILQGESSLRMNEGFWHFPTSIFPGERGNFVVIGHRFLHLPPRKDTLFNLEDISIGEEIVVETTHPLTLEQEQLRYIVVETRAVEANDVSIIEETQDYRLTLITCTPLWTSEKRFVVIAKLDKLYKRV